MNCLIIFSLVSVGAKVLATKLDERKVRRERENEKQEMQNTLDKYLSICSQRGVRMNVSSDLSLISTLCGYIFICKEIVYLSLKGYIS